MKVGGYTKACKHNLKSFVYITRQVPLPQRLGRYVAVLV